jgi:undecaprenyl-diphosphatase
MTATKLTSRKNIKAILNIFDTAPRPILIHCQSGIDRTGEVSALWALDQQHKSHSTALAQLTLLYRYSRFANPKKVAKEFLIKKWRGRSWFEKEYNPAKFSKFEAQAD